MASINAKHSYRFGYLKSEHWGNLRLEKLVEQGARCQVCGKENVSNDVHHVVYPPSLYDATVADLVVLCRRHHDEVHEILEQHPEIKGLGGFEARWNATFALLKDVGGIYKLPADFEGKPTEARKFFERACIPKSSWPSREKDRAATSMAKRLPDDFDPFPTRACHREQATWFNKARKALSELSKAAKAAALEQKAADRILDSECPACHIGKMAHWSQDPCCGEDKKLAGLKCPNCGASFSRKDWKSAKFAIIP